MKLGLLAVSTHSLFQLCTLARGLSHFKSLSHLLTPAFYYSDMGSFSCFLSLTQNFTNPWWIISRSWILHSHIYIFHLLKKDQQIPGARRRLAYKSTGKLPNHLDEENSLFYTQIIQQNNRYNRNQRQKPGGLPEHLHLYVHIDFSNTNTLKICVLSLSFQTSGIPLYPQVLYPQFHISTVLKFPLGKT